MNKQKNIPTLRFPEFDMEWEEKCFGDVATNKAEKYNPVNSNKFIKCIELEHLDSESGQLLGFSDGSNLGSIKNKFNKGEVLFGKLRPYLKKYLLTPFSGVCSSEIWVLKGIEISNDFLYRVIQTNKFLELANQSSGSKMPRADWNVVEKGSFFFPLISEQNKIANFLSAVDQKLHAFKKKKSLLEAYKKGVMQQLFRQPEPSTEVYEKEEDHAAIKSHPSKKSKKSQCRQLRFMRDDGGDFPDWEVKKLGEVTYKVDKKNKKVEQLPIYSISNKNGFVPQSEQFEGMDSNERGYDISLYKIIENNTFAYNPARINVGSIGYSGDLGRLIVSSLYVCFKTSELIDDNFFNCYLDSFHFKNSVLSKGEGGVRIYLFYENFSEITINLPPLPEQTKIANFLSALDEKINGVQAQIEKMEVWKKGLLQSMFV